MTTTEDKNPVSARNSKPRYIMIGGFLGSGKTTAVGALARKLVEQGLRVGLITNDQGCNLVDTSMLRSLGFATEEIPGGCFCCRFDSLVDASQKLTLATRPDVFIAEPVGSCTDLAATVTYPLRQLRGQDFTVAPVSVLVDPVRALCVFGLETGGSFSEKVLYIYLKQIEEADLVVISKCDMLDDARIESLRHVIAARFPGKDIMAVSARKGTNLDAWLARVMGAEQVPHQAMKVDYQVYADGEAMLGWLNCTVMVKAQHPFEADAFLKELAGAIQKRLDRAKAQVAHLKMTLSPQGGRTDALAAVNLVRSDSMPEVSMHLNEPVTTGQLIVNLRAEAAPDVLGTAVRQGLAAAVNEFSTMRATLDRLEHFRPGKPTPTHRVENPTA